ncbi:MazF family toxin-antitoxin system [Clostridia bacterium]|nr:MazF family toxin-antitoxin system [Clostridia bacterium]
MRFFDIYIAFVSWGEGGKRRPVLILDENSNGVTVFNITTRYGAKRDKIRENYFLINDWQQAGLDKKSYVDTNKTVTLPLTAIERETPIGRLSAADEQLLLDFLAKQKS